VTARELTVAHQAPGECAYCDERYAAIVAAVAHELAEKIRESAPTARSMGLGTETAVLAAADLIDPEVPDGG